jgi:hypothetical protein
MKRLIIFVTVIFLVFVIGVPSFLWGQEKNLSVNKEVTAKIRAFDREFFKGFDVYSAGTYENPTALLFDIKDDYKIASPLWEEPLPEEKIVSYIQRMDDQFINRYYGIPFEPRALNIVNSNGKVLGYVYTGLFYVIVASKKDGRLTVYLPSAHRLEGGGGIMPPSHQ